MLVFLKLKWRSDLRGKEKERSKHGKDPRYAKQNQQKAAKEQADAELKKGIAGEPVDQCLQRQNKGDQK